MKGLKRVNHGHLLKLSVFFSMVFLFGVLVVGQLSAKIIRGDGVYEYTDNQAVSGGILRTFLAVPPRSLDPQHGTGSYTAAIANFCYSSLLRLTQKANGIEPDLAESYRQLDPLTYEFKLRKGIHFHDLPPVNGREFTSEDVRYSIRHMLGEVGDKKKAKRKFYFEGKIASIETPDKYTVIIKTNKPYATFINYIANTWMAMIPREAIEEWGDLRSKALGTGPFMVEEYIKGSHIKLVKHQKYHLKGQPYLDGINCKFITTPSSSMAAFLANELDVAGLESHQVETVAKQDPRSNIYALPGFYTRILRTAPWIEGKIPIRKPFDNKKVRQAIAYSIDKVRLLNLAHEGEGDVSVGMIPAAYKPWALPASDQWEYNPEKAKKLLAEAGYPDGFSTELITWNSSYMTKPAQIIQEMLHQTGIKVNINAMEFSQYFNRAYRFQYDMALHITTAAFEPEEWLVPYFGKLETSTYYKWSDHNLWDRIEQQQYIMDRPKRVAEIQDIQRYVMDECMSQALFTTTRYSAAKPYVHRKRYLHESMAEMHGFTWMERH